MAGLAWSAWAWAGLPAVAGAQFGDLDLKPREGGFERPVRSIGVKVQPQYRLFVVISRDGSRVAAGGNAAALMIWDAADGHALHVLDQGHETLINAVAFSADGRWVASGGPARLVEVGRGFGLSHQYEGAVINIWEVSTGRRVASIDPGNVADAFQFAPNGDLVAVTGGVHRVSSWAAESGRPSGFAEMGPASLQGYVYTQLARVTSFSDDARRIVAYDHASGVSLRDLDKPGVRDLPLAERRATPAAVALSGDGKRVAVIGFDHSLSVWDFETMALRRSVRSPVADSPHNRPVLLAFGPGGKTILSGSEDGVVRIWDEAGDRPIRTIVEPPYPVRAVAFVGDGLRVVSGGCSEPGNHSAQTFPLRIWDVAPDRKP